MGLSMLTMSLVYLVIISDLRTRAPCLKPIFWSFETKNFFLYDGKEKLENTRKMNMYLYLITLEIVKEKHEIMKISLIIS